MKRRSALIGIVLLVVLFGAVRIPVILANIDLLHEIDRAEIKNFSLARAFTQKELRGHWVDTEGHHGGFTLNVILYSLVSRVLGENFLSLKMVAFLFALGTLIVWSVLLARLFSPAVALLFGILTVFSSAVYVAWTSTVWGGHPEMCLYTGITILVYFTRIYTPVRARLSDIALCGLLCGLFSYLAFLFIPFIAFLLIYHLVARGLPRMREAAAWAASFIAVSVPLTVAKELLATTKWHLLSTNIGNAPETTLHYMLFQNDPVMFLSTLVKGFVLPLAPVLRPPWTSVEPASLQLAATLVTVALALLSLAQRRDPEPTRRPPTAFFLLFPLWFYMVVGFVNPERPKLQYRYLVPLFPFLYALCAMGTAAAFSLARRLAPLKALAAVLFLALVALGVSDHWVMLNREGRDRWRTFDAMAYANLNIGRVHLEHTEGVNRFIATYRENPSPPLIQGFRIAFPLTSSHYQCLFMGPSCIAALPGRSEMEMYLPDPVPTGAEREEMLRGFGWGIGIKRRWDLPASVTYIRALLPEDEALLLRGLGFGLGITLNPAEVRARIAGVDPRAAGPIRTGLREAGSDIGRAGMPASDPVEGALVPGKQP